MKKATFEEVVFEVFCKEVKAEIRDYLPEEYAEAEIDIVPVNKPSGSYTGLSIKLPDSDMCPIFNMEEVFTKTSYNEEEACRFIADNISVKPDILTEEFAKAVADFDVAKPHLAIRVCDMERAADALKTMPYHELGGGYAITYQLAYPSDDGMASTFVTDGILRNWGISKELLHEAALTNSQAQYPARLYNIMKLMGSIMGGENPDQDGDLASAIGTLKDEPMMVLMTTAKYDGAAAIAYPGVLEQISAELGSFYILPSSRHEVIVVPANHTEYGCEELAAMVHEINETEVKESDRLSDTVLFYDKESGSLIKAADRAA